MFMTRNNRTRARREGIVHVLLPTFYFYFCPRWMSQWKQLYVQIQKLLLLKINVFSLHEVSNAFTRFLAVGALNLPHLRSFFGDTLLVVLHVHHFIFSLYWKNKKGRNNMRIMSDELNIISYVHYVWETKGINTFDFR